VANADGNRFLPGAGKIEWFKDLDAGPEMVVVPASRFLMGSPEDEADRYPEEGPQHEVTIAQPFAVARFAVTFDEWDACVAAGGCEGYRPDDNGWGRGRRPVIYVSWNDAAAYVEWLSHETGKPYRLLSESEREYVARADTITPFWWGTLASSQHANFDGRRCARTPPYSDGSKGAFPKQTLSVDTFQPNAWAFIRSTAM
jgi:formylglycine-generating enzyme required for sulfatase activity